VEQLTCIHRRFHPVEASPLLEGAGGVENGCHSEILIFFDFSKGFTHKILIFLNH
jgi:hypothetical protein